MSETQFTEPNPFANPQVFKPASDPETIQQGLAEGWIKPKAETPPKPKRGRPKGKIWYGTTDACEMLGISRWTLKRMKDGGTLQRGKHWKSKNPHAKQWTYLWNVGQIEKLQSEELA